mmetsp:Transcript_44756/g.74666  ORF Transcript_44756/g.74666 Transcript_44756/m.74666 type:complete len:227 (-) Transcript_44756:537-1217(-)
MKRRSRSWSASRRASATTERPRSAMLGSCTKSMTPPVGLTMTATVGSLSRVMPPCTMASTRTSVTHSVSSSSSSLSAPRPTLVRHGAIAIFPHILSAICCATHSLASWNRRPSTSLRSTGKSTSVMADFKAWNRCSFHARAWRDTLSEVYIAFISSTSSGTTSSGTLTVYSRNPPLAAATMRRKQSSVKACMGFLRRCFTPPNTWKGSSMSLPAVVGLVETTACRQ